MPSVIVTASAHHTENICVRRVQGAQGDATAKSDGLAPPRVPLGVKAVMYDPSSPVAQPIAVEELKFKCTALRTRLIAEDGAWWQWDCEPMREDGSLALDVPPPSAREDDEDRPVTERVCVFAATDSALPSIFVCAPEYWDAWRPATALPEWVDEAMLDAPPLGAKSKMLLMDALFYYEEGTLAGWRSKIPKGLRLKERGCGGYRWLDEMERLVGESRIPLWTGRKF